MSVTSRFSLSQKVIIQFGGTGLLGRALIDALAEADATLVVATRNRAALEELAAAQNEAGHHVEVEEVDIGSEESLHALRDRVLTTRGRVDGIVFNAVTRPMTGPDGPLDQWRESMDVNATGFFATVRAFGDAMAERGSGSIVNIASQMGMVGSQPWLYEGTDMKTVPDYFYHKGGMINLTRHLASHYGERNVRVNAVSPGGIFNPDNPPAEAFQERYGKMTMLGRMANAEEIGGAVVFLLSDASSYITGTNLPIDGGYTAK